MQKHQLLPEWAPVQAVMLAWPYPHGDWKNNYAQVSECYWQILRALSTYSRVWLLLKPGTDQSGWRKQGESFEVQWANVEVFDNVDYNDTWIRDYGPLSLSDGYLTFTFNGWGGKYPAELDTAVAQSVFTQRGLALRELDFVCEGGGLETNGTVALLNRDCIVETHRNAGLNGSQVEQLLQDELGFERIYWLEDIGLSGDDTDGHIDTIARFCSETLIVYSGRNSDHPDAEALERLHSQLQTHATEGGFELLELPTPVIRSQIDGRILPATYANFLVVNDTVFVPVYNVEQDREALRVLTQAFPEHRLMPLSCEALLEQHGSLHCATMQVAWPHIHPDIANNGSTL